MIVCQDVSDHLNVGSVFRLADALGVREVLLCGQSPVPPHKKIGKTARSTDRFVPYRYFSTTVEALENLQADHYQIIGLEITDESQPIDQFQPDTDRPLALVIGSESLGILPATLALLDAAVHIPMYGRNTSMNVVQACGIAVYELSRKMMIR